MEQGFIVCRTLFHITISYYHKARTIMKRILFTPALLWLFSVFSPALAQPTLSFTTDATDLAGLSVAGGTFTIEVTSGGDATSWTAAVTQGLFSGGSGFVRIDKTAPDGDPPNVNIITVTYLRNRTTAERVGEITLMSVGGVGTAMEVISLTQLGPELRLVLPDGVDLSALPVSNGSFVVEVTGGWNLALDPPTGFLFASPSTNQVSFSYGTNTGFERTAVVTFTTTGTGELITREFNVRQLAAPPTLSISTNPSNLATILALPTGGGTTGTITATITLGGGAERWTATEIEDLNNFVSFTPTSGDRIDNTLTITYNENIDLGRSATLTIATEGGTGAAVTQDLVITQLSGPPTISGTSAPADLSGLSALAGSFTIAVETGVGATGWTAEVTQGADFASINKTTAGNPNPANTITVTYGGSPNTDARVGVITLTTVGGAGEVTEEVAFTQVGRQRVTGTTTTVPLVDDLEALPAGGGTIVVDVELLGSATGWTAATAATPLGYLELDRTSGGEDDDLTITYTENTGGLRVGTIVVRPTGGSGPIIFSTFIIRLEQPAAHLIILDNPPSDFVDFRSSGGTVDASMLIGGSATGWEVYEEVDTDDFFSISPMGEAGSGTRPFTIAYEPNPSSSARSGSITLRTTGTPAPPQDVTITISQLGAAEIVATTTPTSLQGLSNAGGSVDVGVELLGGATDWSASIATNPNGFLTLTETGGTGDGSFTINYAPNNEVALPRVGVVRLSSTGGTGTAEDVELRITQAAGVLHFITLTPSFDITALPVGGGAFTYTVESLTGGATSWSASIFTGDFFILTDADGDGGTDNVLTFDVEPNNTTSGRTGTIAFATAGPTGVPFSRQVTFFQVAGEVHTIDATPTFTPARIEDNLSAVGGSISIQFALGGGATGWSARTDADNVTLGEVVAGNASTPLVFSYAANLTSETGGVVVILGTTGPTGESLEGRRFFYAQEGAPGIAVTTVPADITTLTATAGTIDVGVELLGSAEGWSAAITSDTEGFLDLPETSGDGDLDINYGGNRTRASRTGTVTLTGTGGRGTPLSTVLEITQLAGEDHTITIVPSVTESELQLPNGATFMITVESLGGGAESWTSEISEGASFTSSNNLAGDASSDNVAVVILRANDTANEREFSFTYTTVGTGGFPVSETISFTQSPGSAHTLTPMPTFTPVLVEGGNLTVAGGEISIDLGLGSGALSWTASENLDYVGLTSPSGLADESLVLTYDPNPTFETREVTVSVTTSGEAGISITENISFTQSARPPTFTFTSSGLTSLPASSNAPVIDVTLSTATGFTAVLTQGGDFASIGTSVSTVTLSLDENTAAGSRDGIITLTETGGSPAYTVEIPFTQSGTEEELRVTTRPDLSGSLSTESGVIEVDVALLGGETGWDAEITNNPAGFFPSNALSAENGVGGTNVLTITYTENTGAVRTGEVTLTPTLGEDPVVLTITQLGLPLGVVVSVPDGRGFECASCRLGGTIVANVALTGGLTDWTVAASSTDNFITFGAETATTQEIIYATNPDLLREGQVTFTGTGVGFDNVVQTIDFRQLASVLPTLSYETTSDLTRIPAELTGGGTTGTITGTITLGGGAESWTATKSGDDDDAFITGFTTSGDRTSNTLTITYNANTGMERSAVLAFQVRGSVSQLFSIDITQLAALPTLTFETTPSDLTGLTELAGSFTIAVSTDGAATGWTAVVTSDGDFASIDKEFPSGVSPNVITVTYLANADTDDRTGTITLTSVGGSPADIQVVSFTQVGLPGLLVSTAPSDLTSLSSETGTISVNVALFGSATGWRFVRSDDPAGFLSWSGTSGVGGTNVLQITYQENTGAISREGSITLETTGGVGTPQDTVLTITQGFGPPMIRVGIVTDAGNTEITPSGTNYVVSSSTQRLTVPITLTGTAERVSIILLRTALFLRYRRYRPLL